MTTCNVVMFVLPGHPVCAEPAEAQVTSGCVHEHIEDDWMCSRHASLARENDLICSVCKTIDGHSCQVFALAEVNAAGERRVLVGAGTDLREAS